MGWGGETGSDAELITSKRRRGREEEEFLVSYQEAAVPRLPRAYTSDVLAATHDGRKGRSRRKRQGTKGLHLNRTDGARHSRDWPTQDWDSLDRTCSRVNRAGRMHQRKIAASRGRAVDRNRYRPASARKGSSLRGHVERLDRDVAAG